MQHKQPQQLCKPREFGGTMKHVGRNDSGTGNRNASYLDALDPGFAVVAFDVNFYLSVADEAGRQSKRHKHAGWNERKVQPALTELMEGDCTIASLHLNQQHPEFAMIQGRLTAFLAVLARGVRAQDKMMCPFSALWCHKSTINTMFQCLCRSSGQL